MSSPSTPPAIDSDVPAALIVALNLVQNDEDTLSANQTTAAQAATALATAQQNANAANSAVTSAQAQLAGDLAALIALANQTYGSVPAAPAAA